MKTRKRTQAAFAQPESLVVAEEVGEDRDQDPDPDHEEEDLEGDEEQFPEADVGKEQGGPFGGWQSRSRSRRQRYLSAYAWRLPQPTTILPGMSGWSVQ